MARGILSGIGLGAVFSVSVAGMISVLVPLQPQPAPQLGTAAPVAPPQPATPQAAVTVAGGGDSPAEQPQVSLRAPSGEDLPKEPAAAALAPQTTSELDISVQDIAPASEPVTVPRSDIMTSVTTPSVLPPVDSAASDSTPAVPAALPQPRIGGAADLTQPRPQPQGVIARVGDDAPVLPNPQALAPMIPDDSQDQEIPSENPQQIVDLDPAQDAQQSPEPAQSDAAQTEVQETDQQGGEEIFTLVEPAPDQVPEPESQAQEGAALTVQTVRPRVTTVPGTQVGTLGTQARPAIGTPANTLINRTGQNDEDAVAEVAPASTDPAATSPIRRYAQPFENPEGKPLMGIVLMDTGADLDAAGIGLPALSSFPYPVSFAVDVTLPDAAKRVERYRSEGFDVLAMVDLPKGARPSDAEVSISVALNGMPEIVGVLEGTGEGLQGSREVADQVTRILQASGHGLVAQSKGLDTMPKLALKEGVPAAAVFRDFDGAGQQPRVIRRFLDQAAFKAGQEGGVILLGRLRSETIEALLVWGLADRAGSVALAPVSAVLLGQ